MKQMKKGILIFSLLFGFFCTQSCEEDDVCVGEGTPYLTVVFRDILNAQNQKDSLTIYSADNINFENPTLVYNKAFLDSLKLPLGGLDTDKTYFTIQRRSNAVADTLTVSHQTITEYVSKACGFRVVYEGLNYHATENHFQYIIPGESNELKNESETNLYIVLGN